VQVSLEDNIVDEDVARVLQALDGSLARETRVGGGTRYGTATGAVASVL